MDNYILSSSYSLVLKNGEIIETGKTKDVFTKPQHEYTRQLVQASVLFQEGLC